MLQLAYEFTTSSDSPFLQAYFQDYALTDLRLRRDANLIIQRTNMKATAGVLAGLNVVMATMISSSL
jgi:hypothetical protein